MFGVTNQDIRISEEATEAGIANGWGIDSGVADFPEYGEDINYTFATMLGMKLDFPRSPVGLFVEAGYGQLERVSAGLTVKINR